MRDKPQMSAWSQIKNIAFILFYQKKRTTNAHKIICETYGENVIAIKTCAN